jgi:uncharacterized protein YbjT (DUF2867 family)
MKILVIGATGLTGTIAVRLLLDRKDDVTAFVRGDYDVAGVRVAKGDARDEKSLVDAVKGQDAVLSAFGPRGLGKSDIQEVFMRNLTAAMKANGVKRFVNLSAWGAGDTRDTLPLVGRIFLKLLLKDLFADKDRGEKILFASELDYVNVRPGRLSNGKARGGVKASLDPKAIKPTPFMARADLAAFMVDQLRDDTWVRKSPLIGY